MSRSSQAPSSLFSGPSQEEGQHIPVLVHEMVSILRTKPGGLYLDGTFGGGGYTQALLEADPTVSLIVLDRDPEAMIRAERLKRLYPGRIRAYQGCFSQLPFLAKQEGWPLFQGIVFDFGVSSFQLDQAHRGFSFSQKGPLDMRMSSGEGLSAADVVNTFDEKDLIHIFRRYGEEPRAKRIAAALVARRAVTPFVCTGDLSQSIESLLGRRWGEKHPATLVFQALRIFVNDELREIEKALQFVKTALAPEGRFAMVTFHSLEDRLVKEFIRAHSSSQKESSRLLPGELEKDPFLFRALSAKGIIPQEEEKKSNPRSRSARLRAAERL